MLADCDPDRNSDQVCIVELDARSLVTVIYHNFNAHGFELLLDVISHVKLNFVTWLDYSNDDMIRSCSKRPDDTLLIMVLLYDSLHRSCDTDTVASHPVRVILALLILECCIHALGILESQLEYLSDLDTSSELDRLAAVRTWISFLKCLDICNDVTCVISAVAYVQHVVVFLVGTCAHVNCSYELGVYYYDAVLESYRACESGNAACCRACNCLIGELDVVLRNVESVYELDHVELSVTSDEACDVILRLQIIIICSEHKSLDGLLNREVQIIADILDGLGSRCEYNLSRLHLFLYRLLVCKLSSLYCSCHSAVVAVQDI